MSLSRGQIAYLKNLRREYEAIVEELDLMGKRIENIRKVVSEAGGMILEILNTLEGDQAGEERKQE